MRDSRFESIYSEMSGRELAHLIIDSFLSDGPKMSGAEKQRIMNAIDPNDGSEFNRVIDDFGHLWGVLQTLSAVANSLHLQLLERDRVVWFLEGMARLSEAASLELSNNVAATPSLHMRCPLATVRIGEPPSKPSETDFHPAMQIDSEAVDALDLMIGSIRGLAVDAKAAAEYVTTGARQLRLRALETRLSEVIDPIIEFDRPLQDEIFQLIENGNAPEDIQRPLFPLGRRWALIWEDVEEDSGLVETIDRGPENWVPTHG